MFERIQNDGVVPKQTTVGAPARADLVVSPTPPSTELREQAVTPTVASQRSSSDNDPLHPLMVVIGQIREEMDGQVRDQAEDKRLQELYAKLFKAYGRVSSGQDSDLTESDIDRTLDQLDAALMPKSESGEASPVVQDENAAAQALRQQRERMLEKIALAMRKVGVLRNKLSEVGEQSHDRLVNINTSIASLNMARTQLDDSSFAITSAASTVDSVMLNLRSAVFAHGKISADLVRLVMS
jgi:chromosome segregation ATPase